MEHLNPKKILVLVTSDHGGAGEYMYKIMQLLKNQGHTVVMCVKMKIKEDQAIIEINTRPKKRIPWFKKLQKKFNKRKYTIELDPKYHYYGIDEASVQIDSAAFFKEIGCIPDVIFSGWTAGFINSTELVQLQQFSQAKVYTVTVDMNHFTGGCHYAWDCKGYIDGCSTSCPAVINPYFKDLSQTNFEIKLRNVQKGNFKVITGSGWTLTQAKESKIYRNQEEIVNLNSLIDTEIMQPKDKSKAKDFFHLDADKFYIMMGCQFSNDSRKGFDYLLESLEILYRGLNENEQNRINVLLISSDPIATQDQIPFNTTKLDYITDYKTLALLYQAADVFVNSSVEDSGPMMVSEAMACGTPVVGFDMGIVNDMVITGKNGYRAKLKDSTDLAKGMKEIFDLNEMDYATYSKNAVAQIQQYCSINFGSKLLEKLVNE